MIRLDCEQGSVEWSDARLGVATASCFGKIITPKTMKLSDQSIAYAQTLLAEQILKRPMDDGAAGAFVERGALLEKHAVDFYELQRERDTEKVGFVLRDDRRVGCSPDRFVGSDGLLEIKCPAPATHIGYLLDADGIGYRAQVQGQLWVCEREWCDTLSYHPDMPMALVRQKRDEEFIAKLAACVTQFLGMIEDMKLTLVDRGYFPELDVREPWEGLKLA